MGHQDLFMALPDQQPEALDHMWNFYPTIVALWL